jgi:uncharacterized protein YgbK (DUF1537 family)
VADALRLLILADDFTGACDAAAPFAAGGETLVVLSAGGARSRFGTSAVDVLAVDLDLRECTDLVARPHAEAAARGLTAKAENPRVFLKIDSTLRGPVAGLVDGALSGSGKNIAVLAPAFPEQGRTLHEGRVMLDGKPGASLTEALGMDGTALVGARFVSSAADVERAVEHARMRGARRIVVDADASECLRRVATAWQRHADWLLVGSGGLSRQVAAARDAAVATQVPPGTATDAATQAPTVKRAVHGALDGGPVLVVAGSPASMTAAQLERLRDMGSFTVVTANPPAPPLPHLPHDLLVLCTRATTERDAGESAQAVADTVLAWSEGLLPAAVVLAGGATARKVCERLGAVGLRLTGEVSPGIPIGHLLGGVWDQVPVVTKAGGFGTPDTLLDVLRALGRVSTQP